MARKKLPKDTNLYIAYYRVSTDKQGERGLGMQAQQDAITEFFAKKQRELGLDASDPNAPRIFASYVEVETGTRKKKRPSLDEALALCQRLGATLVIAKLDRLARNVHFISGLMESGVNFVALDFPLADKFTIHIMAAFAEREAEVISKRTSDAIQVRLRDPNFKNSLGHHWGNPRGLLPEKYQHLPLDEAKAAWQNDNLEFARRMFPTINYFLQNRRSLARIARELNRLNYPTASGKGQWYANAVKMCIEKVPPHERKLLAKEKPDPIFGWKQQAQQESTE